MRDRLDEVDRHILRLLQHDGRISNAELARRVGLSPPSVLQRVRKLEEMDLIQGYAARLHYDQMGFGLKVMAMVSLSLHQDQAIENFRKAVQSIPEVLECLHVSGDFDFLMKIVVRDMPGYETLIREKISTIKGIARIQSCFVLNTAKDTWELPI